MKLKNIVTTGLLTAMAVVLPMALHSIPKAGNIFLPMHLPVLLCGLLCGLQYGLVCGVLAPLASNLVSGMPAMAYLPSMLFELAVYGAAAGAFAKIVRTKNGAAHVYLALISAMLAGRIVYGLANALVFQAGKYSLQVWLTSAFVTALPGIAIQLALIPALVFALRAAKLFDRETVQATR